MGLPTTAKYIVLATIAAPAIMHFGVPAMAAHLFILYFGILADLVMSHIGIDLKHRELAEH